MRPNLVRTSNCLGGLIPTQACMLQQLTPLVLFLPKPIVLLENFLRHEIFTRSVIMFMRHCLPYKSLKDTILHITLYLFLQHYLNKYVFYMGRPQFVICILLFMCRLIQISHTVSRILYADDRQINEYDALFSGKTTK